MAAAPCRRLLWLTGGADAYMGPMLVLPALYVAYFFPARYAWPLASLEIVTYASPLVTTAGARTADRRLRRGQRVAYVASWPTDQSSSAAGRRRARTSTRWPAATRSRGSRTGARSTRRSRPRSEQPRFTLLLADVDDFKQINDRFGHTTGDRVLRELAAHASAAVRHGDCLARIGGDELRWSPRRRLDAVAARGGASVRRRAGRQRRRPRLAHRLRGRLPRGRQPTGSRLCAPRPRPARDQGRARDKATL